MTSNSSMIIERDVPIPASDGLVLRGDVYRPEGSTPVPTIMVLGPYGKGVSYKTGYKSQWDWLVAQHPDMLPGSKREFMTWETVDPELWTAWGYACVRVDMRGCGRSPGVIDVLSARETRDFYDAIEWAGTRDWSNGKVGLLGISYYAMTQWRVAALHPPHLTAMIPWEGCGDAYREMIRHGGIVSNKFFEGWFARQVISAQHGNPQGQQDPWLGELATGPETLSPEELKANAVDTLAEIPNHPLFDDWFKERSVDYSKVEVPFLSSANWGGTGLHGRGNYEGFTQASSKQKWLEIHPGRHDEAFYLDDAMALQRRFMDHFLLGKDNGWDREPPVLMEQRRPGQAYAGLRKEPDWPLPNTQWTRMHLSASDKALSTSPPSQQTTESVTFDATGGPAIFTSGPLPNDTELTGPIAAKFQISSTTTDADLFVTFQAFAPDGTEVEFQGGWDPHTPLGQGWLRVSHRKLDTEQSKPYRPFHSHDELQPLEPGKIYEVDVEIWPTHIILPAGYQIAVRIEGHDFERAPGPDNGALTGGGSGSGPFYHNLPADRGSDVFKGKTTIHTGGDLDSFLLLPIIPS